MDESLKDRVEVVQGDITRLRVDGIVNAANTSLLGGGGVDGAIHRAAGRRLVEECRMLHGCRTGQAKITAGYDLPARWVIHTVGPVWQGGEKGEDEMLATAWRNSLKIAADKEMETVAFPSISTGAYRFPLERAARIAVREVHRFLSENPYPRKVIFCAFEEEAYREYLTAVQMEF
ncbi:O-acetyl-ADP-ribose deacetylase [Longimicrobium sp.]|uniref:O-acetyl-ADP-ribose deacetylase n=1 Tax=Longimicrobium sp. TaxID=2029185 RepID=UPI002C1C4006|nr:O-acetyl-ADP-ribose deacetylase [Longimicrobium sp.]HSU17335.1 O-acetyl-ADP-ribose deacetylase [Longimicrobium sp.]